MVKERDEESGQYTQTVSDDELVAFLSEQGGAGTSEVASAFDYKQPTVYRRLKRLEEDDRVISRKIGGSLLWEVDNE
ncbi:hypothetical protein [Haladaptatus salinisoli]|uniref:hypothetical protein n=1 Tax=Haladaptatus salinisoli TaxID=2884876 RepID=UPI001D0A7ED2|nr:hypothetical protein [Haladaptatus salinisoli]